MHKKLQGHSVIPLYYQLKEILLEEIEGGNLKPGDLIPSENQLMRQFQISRNTVKKAIEDLVQEGVLYRVQGKGTFVSTPKFEQPLTGFYSFSKVMKERRIPTKDEVVSVSICEPGLRIKKNLNLSEIDKVIEITRLRFANYEPMIFETSYIPQTIIPTVTYEELVNNSLYDLMREKHQVYVTQAKETFEPVLIRDYEAKYLKVKTGYPALLLDRVAYDLNRRPVEYCRSIIRGDKCRFYTELL